MGLLARDMLEKQVRELLAVLPTSCISQAEREDCTSAIRFFVLLKKRVGTDQAFLEKLESLLRECKCEDFLSTIKKFKEDNPDLLASDSTSTLNLPNGTKAGFKPKRGQSERFRSILLRISRTFPRKHLEIMIALPPIPEAEKQSITEGHDLFHQMERHGCISENDTEMLEEILELFSLTDAIKHLTEYQNEFPPIIHELRPTAPIYASPSVSMQAQYGSYGSLPPFSVSPYSNQHQSSHPSHQSLPLPANQYAGSPVVHVSHQQPSPPVSRQASSASYPFLGGQGPTFSSQMSGGSGVSLRSHSLSVSHSAPVFIHAPDKESGEENPNKPSTRQFVPSESPTLPHRPMGETTVQPFPRAPSPPDHTPSSTGSNHYPRPLLNRRPQQLKGNVSAPSSASNSGVYQQPSQEGGSNYLFPSSKVLRLQGPQNLPGDDAELMPPPSKISRPLDHHTGDGCCFSRPAGAEPRRQESASSTSTQEETMSVSTVSSYTGNSDKFSPAVSAEGSRSALNTLESYSAEHSFASTHQPGEDIQHSSPSAQRNPRAHSVPSYEAESLNVPEGQSCEPSLPSLHGASGSIPSNAGLLSTFSGESNFSPPSQAQQQPENGASVSPGSGHRSGAQFQFRNVPGSPGVPQHAHRPDDVAVQPPGGGGYQPFHQQASYSAAVVPHSLAPSAPGGASLSYQGPPSSIFPSEAPEGTHSSLPNVSPNRNLVMSKTAAKQAYQSGDFVSQNEPVTTEAAIAKNVTPVGGESRPPGSGQKHRQRSSRVYSKPVTPSKSRPVMSKNEAQNVHKAAEFESLNEAVGGAERLSQYQQQLHNFRQRYAAGVPSHAQVTEQGLPVTQASSLSNVSLQGGTLKEDEKQQFPSAAENVSHGGSLYPTLPSLDTSTGTTGATQTGTKRGRAKNQLPEGLEDKEGEVKEEEEQKPSCAKKQKTDKRVTRSEAKKKSGLLSRFVGFVGSAFFGSGEASIDTGGSSSDEQLPQEKSENTESESEFYDAEEN